MKKQMKLKGFEDFVGSHELFPFVDRALSPHTYTPRSHENLLRSYSKLKARESGSKNYKHENKQLKAELKRVNEEVRKNQEEIQLLRNRLINAKQDVTNKAVILDYGADMNGTQSGYNVLNTGETLIHHFSEMMRRYHSTLADKNRQIESLQEKLAQYENHDQRNPPEEQIWSQEYRAPPSVKAERLRRTNAAVQVFRRDLGLVKTQLEHSPLDEQRFPHISSRDRVVLAELRRRQRFGVIADLEAMGNKFFQRLEFEERLDKLHWELESRRYLEHNDTSCGECTYRQEFQMLEITRNNLLKALRDLRAASTHHEPQTQLEAPVSIKSIQTLYEASADFVQSRGNVRETTSELPDK